MYLYLLFKSRIISFISSKFVITNKSIYFYMVFWPPVTFLNSSVIFSYFSTDSHVFLSLIIQFASSFPTMYTLFFSLPYCSQ